MEYTKGKWWVFVADHFIQVHTSKSTITLEWSEENIANAHLIAAAPLLYEELAEADIVICQLCKRLNPQHAQSPYQDGCEWCQDRDSRLKALAKVEEGNG